MVARLLRVGFLVNHKRVERLYAQEGLQLPRKKSRKRVRDEQVARLRATKLNQIWCVDFISDCILDGRPFRFYGVFASQTGL